MVKNIFTADEGGIYPNSDFYFYFLNYSFWPQE